MNYIYSKLSYISAINYRLTSIGLNKNFFHPFLQLQIAAIINNPKQINYRVN